MDRVEEGIGARRSFVALVFLADAYNNNSTKKGVEGESEREKKDENIEPKIGQEVGDKRAAGGGGKRPRLQQQQSLFMSLKCSSQDEEGIWISFD